MCMTLIKAYGEYWNPDLVNWGRRGRGGRAALKGFARPGGLKKSQYEVDMWMATAVYCLFSDFQPVYVGKSVENLGPRIKSHLEDHKQGRWDLFSFYSLSSAKRDGQASRAGQRQLTPDNVVAAFEAVCIRTFDPPLNRRHERLGDSAVEIVQEGDTRAVRSYLQEILDRLAGEDNA